MLVKMRPDATEDEVAAVEKKLNGLGYKTGKLVGTEITLIGVYGDISFTPEQHNGYPQNEVVMSRANSQKDGAFALAPGYG